MWSVKHVVEEDQNNCSNEDAYLILSLSNSTMILKTGEEIEEIGNNEEVGFYLTGPTLSSGNLFEGRRIVQIFKLGVRLLNGCEIIQELVLEDDIDVGGLGVKNNVTIVSIDILDPFVILLLSNGIQFILLQLKKFECKNI